MQAAKLRGRRVRLAPDGATFTSDNGGSAAHPKVVVAATRGGFYTGVVAVKAGRNAAGTAPNCNAATPPR